MSVDRGQEKIDDLFKTFTWLDKELQTLLFEEINKEIEVFLAEENNGSNLTDGIIIFYAYLTL